MKSKPTTENLDENVALPAEKVGDSGITDLDSREPILRTERLHKRYNARTVVDGVSLELRPGEVAGLLGANGAGKTTTFNMVVGLVRPNKGRVLFDGRNITRWPMYKRARAGIAYLPQEASVFRDLTARQNIEAILEFQKTPRRACRERAQQLLEDLDIAHVADTKAHALSGGERRRVEIGRALSIEPKIFLLDEPFAGIDPIAVADLQDTVRHLKDRGIGVLITDHNVRETLAITDRAYILSDGKILAAGAPAEIAAHPEARRTYLGERFRLDTPD